MPIRKDVAPAERVAEVRAAIDAAKARGFSIAQIAMETSIAPAHLGRAAKGAPLRLPTVERFLALLAKLPEKPTPRSAHPARGAHLVAPQAMRAEMAALRRLRARPPFNGSASAIGRPLGLSPNGMLALFGGRGTSTTTLEKIRKLLREHGEGVEPKPSPAAPITVLAKPLDAPPPAPAAPSTTSIEAVLRMVVSTGTPPAVGTVAPDLAALVDRMRTDAIAFILQEYALATGGGV